MSTNVSSVTSHFPDAENGLTTTTAGSVASGATTVTLNSVAGYTNGMPVVLVIDPSDANKKQTFTGIMDTAGVQVTSVVWTAGTNQTHALGATVVDYATATHIAMISKGIKVSLDQDGTLKAGAVDVAGVLASDVVTTAKILDANVTGAKISSGATGVGNANLLTTAGDIGGAWLAWTPTWTNMVVSSSTVTAKHLRIGKGVWFRLAVVLGGTDKPSGEVSFTLPVTSVSYPGTATIQQLGTATYFNTASVFFGNVAWESTTKARLTTIQISTYPYAVNISATVPTTFAANYELHASGFYEAA